MPRAIKTTADDIRETAGFRWCVSCGRRLKRIEAADGKGTTCGTCKARLFRKR